MNFCGVVVNDIIKNKGKYQVFIFFLSYQLVYI